MAHSMEKELDPCNYKRGWHNIQTHSIIYPMEVIQLKLSDYKRKLQVFQIGNILQNRSAFCICLFINSFIQEFTEMLPT